VGRRSRRRAQSGPSPTTSDYRDADGNILTLRALESQKELLGRYRMATGDERRWVRETLAEHLRERHPDVTV
jgi:hypothetical protein